MSGIAMARVPQRGAATPTSGSARPASRAEPQVGHASGNQARLRTLRIGSADDPLERQADSAAAAAATRMQLASSSDGRTQTTRRGARDPLDGTVAPALVHDVLRDPGRPLDPRTRGEMESGFGQPFSAVRIHDDARAAASARLVRARAYTVGSHIAFARDHYRPTEPAGRMLLAHELAHVVQQAGQDSGLRLQRQGMEPTDVPSSLVLRDAPKAKTWTGAPAGCGPDFCRPLASEGLALDTQKNLWPLLMVGIAVKISSRVLPLWNTWAFGGSSSILDLTKDFGADFIASPTTAKTTGFLMSQVKAKLAASPPSLPTGGIATLDIATLIPADVKAIDDPGSPNQMNFNVIGDIPGNIAGGIGKDQAANPVGAKPSPQDDARIVKGEVTVLDAGANLVVIPNLRYTVKDTIDLCPGNCGSSTEQKATIPMSQWEATGISGDVPFTVDFPVFVPPFSMAKSGAAAAPVSPPTTPPKTTP